MMLLQYEHFSELYELCCFLVVPFSQFFSMYSHLFEGGGGVVEWPSHSPTLLRTPTHIITQFIISMHQLFVCTYSHVLVIHSEQVIPTHWSFTQNKSFPCTGHSLRTIHSQHHPHTTHIYVSPCIGHAQEGSLYIGLPVLASVELYYLALTNIHF